VLQRGFCRWGRQQDACCKSQEDFWQICYNSYKFTTSAHFQHVWCTVGGTWDNHASCASDSETMNLDIRQLRRCYLLMFKSTVRCIQGRNEGDARLPGRRITMGGAESLWGAPNHCGGAPNHYGGRRITMGGAEKSRQYFLQYSTFASERHQVRTLGRQTCFLPQAPSNLVTPLVVSYVAKLLHVVMKCSLDYAARSHVNRRSALH